MTIQLKITDRKDVGILPFSVKALATVSAAAILMFGGTSTAFADDSARIKELENKLEQSMRMINDLSSEVKSMKKGAAKGYSHSLSSQRLDDLESQVLDIDDRVGSRAVAHAFDAASIDLGGFLHNTFTHVDANGGHATGFNRTIFELLLKADLGDNWSAFFAQAFLRQSAEGFSVVNGDLSPNFNSFPAAGVGTDTPIAWANYKHNDELNIRIGRYLTPAGIINIEHFPALLLDTEQPQFLRPFGGSTIFPNFLTGVNAHGQKFFGDNKLKYDAYTGNFSGNAEGLVNGARLAYTVGDLGLTVGGNIQAGEREVAGTNPDYQVYGFDLLVDKGKLLWKNEIFWSDEASTLGNRWAFYSQPAWRINDKWTAFYRYDFLDNGSTGDVVENVVGLTFKPTRNVHLRGIVRHKEFDAGSVAGLLDNEDAQIYQLSATFNF